MNRTCMATLSLVLLSQSAFGAIVYQSSQTANGGLNVSGNALAQVGDKVTLAGTERQVTSVSVGTTLFASGAVAYTGSFTLTLYADDGLVVSGVTMPGTVLGSSTISASYVPGQSQFLVFPFSSVTVPNTLHFQLAENNPQNNFQVQVGSSGSIGTSSSSFIIARSNGNPSFQPFNVGGGNQIVSTITAVPEPGTVLLAGLGALGLVLVARGRKT